MGHNAGVKTVMVYDHGSKAISGSYDHTLQIWDLNSRKAIGSPLIGHTEWVRDLDVYFSDKKALCYRQHPTEPLFYGIFQPVL